MAERRQYTLALGQKLRQEFGSKAVFGDAMTTFLGGISGITIVEGSVSDRRASFEVTSEDVLTQVVQAAEANGFIVSPNVALDPSF
ncbi:MAG: hypothetical protein GC136_01345 [Alphaproteobacteria bacterium]|nr:hypothetical protein [Alphaproteobacteria bacterium]